MYSRIRGRIVVNRDNGCWEWAGLKNHAGYGRIVFNGEQSLAHRFAYETFIGPIPGGAIVCHHCDNPPCLNPAHLFLGTHKSNATDKVAKRRHPRNNATACKRGHEYTAETMFYYVDKRTGQGQRVCRICARESARRRLANRLHQ